MDKKIDVDLHSQPIIFISHSRIKEGKLDEFRRFYRDEVNLVKAEKPGTLVHLAYVSEDGTDVTIVHLFPNADAFDLHMRGGTAERAKRAYEFIESDRLEIYGTPSDGALDMLRKIASSGVALTLKPQNIGGYYRLKPG